MCPRSPGYEEMETEFGLKQTVSRSYTYSLQNDLGSKRMVESSSQISWSSPLGCPISLKWHATCDLSASIYFPHFLEKILHLLLKKVLRVRSDFCPMDSLHSEEAYCKSCKSTDIYATLKYNCLGRKCL